MLHFSSKRGFTLLEMLIVMALLAVLGAIAGASYLQAHRKATLDTFTLQAVSILRRAQQRSIAQEDDAAWGVHFENVVGSTDFIAVFTGSPYNPANIRERVFLPPLLAFSNPSDGASIDVIFSKLAGSPAAAVNIVIRLAANAAIAKTVSVNEAGIVSVQ